MKLKASAKVLKEIMELMDENMNKDLKSKFAKPEPEIDLKEKLEEKMESESPEEKMDSMMDEKSEEAPPMAMEEDDEDMEKLRALYASLK